jgi:hypothetical protein
VRTTLTLDDDVAARLKAEARRSGRPFRSVVNDHLRAALAQRRSFTTSKPFSVVPCDLGGPLPGLSYDDVGGLIEQIEGAGQR